MRAPGATSIVLMVLASVWCSACAESSHDDRSAERGDRLIGGVTATGRELPSTVAIAPIPRSGLVGSAPLPGTCTAARVGDNALLLAAHCVMDPATVDPL